MPKANIDKNGTISLPKEFLQRRHMALEGEYWLDESEGDLILHPCLADIRKIYLEPTTACNLNCRTCIRNIWQDPPAHMSMSTFLKIVGELERLPQLQRLVFTGFGEPLVQPNILEMIERIRRLNILVTLGSNGLLMDKAIAEELVRLGVERLVISVDGVLPETYEKIRGGSLGLVLENIRNLNEVKRKFGSLNPALGIEFVVLKNNLAELPQLAELARHLNAARVLVSNVLPYTEEMRSEVLYGYDPQPPFKSQGWPVKADAWILWGNLELPRMHWGAERRCRFVNDRAMVIGWDGGVSPCYALSHNYTYYAIDGRKKQVHRYVLGNANDEELEAIWMKEDYIRFRSEVRRFHFPSCPDCDLRETCDLRAQNEGCWGWTPSCADCLWAQDIVRCP